MKKLFTLSVLGAAAVLALSSCQKTDAAFASEDSGAVPTIRCKATASIAGSETTKVEFTAREGNKSKVLWAPENEQLAVCEFLDGQWRGNVDSVQRVYTGEFYTVSEDRTKAEFIYELNDSLKASRYDYVAIYPGSAMRKFSKQTKQDRLCQDFAFQIATPQVPTASSPDTAFCIMTAKSLAQTQRCATLAFNFKHISAYGVLTIKGLPLSEGETVTAVQIAAPATHNLLGRFGYYPDDDTIAYENGGSPRISINPKNLDIKSNEAFDLWFGCAPDTLKAGEELSVTVTTSEKVVSANVTLAKDIVLKSGNVATMSINVAKFIKETKKLTFDFTTRPGKTGDFDLADKESWPVAKRAIAATDKPITRTYTLGGVEYDFILADAYGASWAQVYWNTLGYLGLMAGHRYLGLPAIPGYKLIAVSALHSTTSKTRNCGITTKVAEVSGSSFTEDEFVSGGESQNFSTQGQTYSFALKGTKANTVYYFESINTGIGIGSFTLTYENVE